MYVCMYVRMYACMYVCMCVCNRLSCRLQNPGFIVREHCWAIVRSCEYCCSIVREHCCCCCCFLASLFPSHGCSASHPTTLLWERKGTRNLAFWCKVQATQPNDAMKYRPRMSRLVVYDGRKSLVSVTICKQNVGTYTVVTQIRTDTTLGVVPKLLASPKSSIAEYPRISSTDDIACQGRWSNKWRQLGGLSSLNSELRGLRPPQGPYDPSGPERPAVEIPTDDETWILKPTA